MSSEAESSDPLHALFRFHRRIRLSMRTFLRIAESSKAGVEPNQVEVRALTDFFTGPLIWHDIDEEVTLMPRLRRAPEPKFAKLLEEITEQHQRMEEILEGILPHLTDVATGRVKANGALLVTEANALYELLSEHLRLEEQEIFPVARNVLSEEELGEMAVEMSTRLEGNKHKMPRVVPLGAEVSSKDGNTASGEPA
ncbi:MAG: hemerythrin domain-containing protein [Deltaproteobacteria bacterium]|nr:hemerythrin domain-containing protein [Deltaproteobacteria bacterium]